MNLELSLGEAQVYMFEPVPAPRMTKAAAWSDQPGVIRYKQFCAEVRARKIELVPPMRLQFFIATPPSWSEREREQMVWLPHCSKPDCDNLVKGLFDAVFYGKKGGDSHMWGFVATCHWGYESHFIVTPILGGL